MRRDKATREEQLLVGTLALIVVTLCFIAGPVEGKPFGFVYWLTDVVASLVLGVSLVWLAATAGLPDPPNQEAENA